MVVVPFCSPELTSLPGILAVWHEKGAIKQKLVVLEVFTDCDVILALNGLSVRLNGIGKPVLLLSGWIGSSS
jgi:hypothetical protein